MVAANWIVHFLWSWGSDPNNGAIPYLTALGDLLGTGILSLAFVILWHIGDKDQDVAEYRSTINYLFPLLPSPPHPFPFSPRPLTPFPFLPSPLPPSPLDIFILSLLLPLIKCQ
ncbi:Solute carrier family 41 member 1 [Oopsacas minuta]|uniref:Solute carrier family 41 member 1 n=1 Tax=Oopsacas minuta TaxID=111878 RepID=A0AAV7K747_9METZ|nr:Solute carrier family 41 member 1 [Oopsacas minuta]